MVPEGTVVGTRSDVRQLNWAMAADGNGAR
jgi:hypothetical protein